MRDDNRFTYISAINPCNPCNPCLIYTKKLIPHSPPFYRIKQPSLKTAFFSSIDENFLISIIFFVYGRFFLSIEIVSILFLSNPFRQDQGAHHQEWVILSLKEILSSPRTAKVSYPL